MEPYLALITHLWFKDAQVVKVEQSYYLVDVIKQNDPNGYASNHNACLNHGQWLDENVAAGEAYVWQCVPADVSQ